MCLIEQKTLAIALIIRFLFLTKIGGLKVGENYNFGGKNKEIVAGRDKNVITIMFTYFFIEFFFTHMLYRFVFFLSLAKCLHDFQQGGARVQIPARA